jgi:hypothetical protein
MRCYSKAVTILTCCALFTAPVDARTLKSRTKAYHGHFIKRASSCPLHVTAGGELADCRGWRLRSSIGWDNTCFRSLDYLSSTHACTPSTF